MIGQSRTDRIVDRELIEDDRLETPSDGESDETESRDGDRDAFSQRKEEKTIDYYKFQKGKTTKNVFSFKLIFECPVDHN